MKFTMKAEYKIAFVTVSAVILIWFVDAAYNTDPSREVLFLRSLLTGSFLLFGLIIAGMVAKRRRAEETLKKNSRAIESSMDGIAISDRNGNYLYVNQAFASINGYADTGDVIGKTCKQVYDQKEYERIQQTIVPVLLKNGRWRGELIATRKNGSTYVQEASMTMLEDGGWVCVIRDITWRKRSEKRLHRSERFLNTIFDSIRDPFCIFDHDFRTIRVNEAYALMRNKQVKDLIGRKCHEVLHNSTTVCEDCVVDMTFHSAAPCVKEKLMTLQDGTVIWVEIYTYPIFDEEGKVSHAIEYTRNITDRKKAEEEKRLIIGKLEYLSSTDSLTHILNRRALTDSLIYEMDRARRYGSELSLILCDIDNFKEINDTYGHEAGDHALQTISDTLKTILRKADIAGRYGGDEFMIILPETSIKGAEHIADKLLLSVRDTDLRFADDKAIRLSTSIGISGLEADSDTIDSFINRADEAMYASKQSGRDRSSTANPYPLFP